MHIIMHAIQCRVILWSEYSWDTDYLVISFSAPNMHALSFIGDQWWCDAFHEASSISIKFSVHPSICMHENNRWWHEFIHQIYIHMYTLLIYWCFCFACKCHACSVCFLVYKQRIKRKYSYLWSMLVCENAQHSMLFSKIQTKQKKQNLSLTHASAHICTTWSSPSKIMYSIQYNTMNGKEINIKKSHTNTL